MRSKILLLLLTQRNQRARLAQGGFSMAMTIVLVLAVILGTAAVASRNSSGLLATALQGRNREARDVAEAGIVQVINELNRERNRRLLVFGPAAGWNDTDARYRNPCTSLNNVAPNAPFDSVTRPSGSTTTAPTSEALDLDVGANSAWVDLVAGQGNRQFRVVNIQYRNQQDRGSAFPDDTDILAGAVKTLIVVTVEGRVGGAQQTSTTRVTREFEVVPKCCKRSFSNNQFGGNFFGRDNRGCYSETKAGQGLIVSLNGGGFNGNGNKFQIVDDQLPTPQRVVQAPCSLTPVGGGVPNPACVNSSTFGVNVNKVSVVPTEFEIDLLPFPPAPVVTTPGTLPISNTQNYLRVTADKQHVELCNTTSLGSCLKLSDVASDADRRCTRFDRDGDGENEFYCKLTQIDVTNNTIVDTSNGAINIYFDNPTSPLSASHSYFNATGNRTFNHRKCASPSPQPNNQICATPATLADAERLNFFAIDEPGLFSYKGTSDSLAVNIYAPRSRLDLSGNSAFFGRLWVDGFDIGGSVTLQVPTAGGNVCLNPLNPKSICSTLSGQPFIDFVARSVSYSSSF